MAASDRLTTRRRRLGVLASALVLLSGCRVHLGVATEVNDDGSGRIALTVLLGETVRQTLSAGGMVSEDPEELQDLIKEQGPDAVYAEDLPPAVHVLEKTSPSGWRHERIEQGKLEGVQLEASFASVEEIPALLEPLSDWGDEIAARTGRDAEQVGIATLTRGLSVTRDGPIFRFRGRPSGEAYQGATGGPNNLLAVLTVSVKLPGGIRHHDADEEQDGVLVWHVAPGAARSISATSDLTYDPSPFPTGAAIAGAGGAATLALGAFLAWRRRRRAAPGGDDGPPPPEGVREEVPAPV